MGLVLAGAGGWTNVASGGLCSGTLALCNVLDELSLASCTTASILPRLPWKYPA